VEAANPSRGGDAKPRVSSREAARLPRPGERAKALPAQNARESLSPSSPVGHPSTLGTAPLARWTRIGMPGATNGYELIEERAWLRTIRGRGAGRGQRAALRFPRPASNARNTLQEPIKKGKLAADGGAQPWISDARRPEGLHETRIEQKLRTSRFCYQVISPYSAALEDLRRGAPGVSAIGARSCGYSVPRNFAERYFWPGLSARVKTRRTLRGSGR
jgi:hypothetical protein